MKFGFKSFKSLKQMVIRPKLRPTRTSRFRRLGGESRASSKCRALIGQFSRELVVKIFVVGLHFFRRQFFDINNRLENSVYLDYNVGDHNI